MKKAIAIISSLILALLIVFGLPQILKEDTQINANISNNTSLVKQEILSYSDKQQKYYKVYANDNLVGVVKDINYFNSLIEDKYKDYEDMFPNTTLGLCNDVYIVEEKSFIEFENVDDSIMDYLNNHNLLGVKTTAVEFSTGAGAYEIIYVKNIDDFYEARDQFLLNFISEETLLKLINKEQIDSPTELGSVEKSLDMLETISYSEAVVSPNVIFANVSDIYDFLCYGRNTKREYYTVKEGDTLQGVGYYFGNMWPKQLAMINRDVLNSENQIITPGMQLNVTYYTSPITINVTKEVLTQQFITPEVPEYIEDDTLEAGKTVVITEEEMGIKNVLFEETWVNGVLQEGEELSETVIKQPIRGKIAVGTKIVNLIGTGNYVWPVDNPYITTDFGGYFGHTGTDFINLYQKYCNVYAVDSGVVDEVGYKYDMGYYCMINHQNGIRTFYMHLNAPAYVSAGENVYRGQVIGQEGNSGVSYGAHLHLTFEVNGSRVNACNYLPCNLIR